MSGLTTQTLEIDRISHHPLEKLAVEHLYDTCLRPHVGTTDDVVNLSVDQMAEHIGLRIPFRQRLADSTVSEKISAALAPEGLDIGNERTDAVVSESLGHFEDDHGTLRGKGALRNPPAVVLLSDRVVDRNADFFQEHLAEFLGSGQLLNRSHFDSICMHVHDEVGDALVLRSSGIGSYEEDAPIGVLRMACPNLLASDHVVVTVAYGTCLQPGEVRASIGLGEALTPTSPLSIPGRRRLRCASVPAWMIAGAAL